MDKPIRVSIVEDRDDIRTSLQLLINGSPGFSCEYVYSSAEGAIQDLPGKEVDVILMDINLPGLNGLDCLLYLKDKTTAQFMMCTVYDDDENIFAALSAGAGGYILKGTTPVQILEAIHDLHNGGSPMSSGIARRVVASFSNKKERSGNLDILTPREIEILNFLSQGYLYKEIASSLFISRETVKKHIHNIYAKLQVQNRTEALNKAFPK